MKSPIHEIGNDADPRLSRIKIMISTWVNVFRFAILLVTITIFFDDITVRRPVTNMSLKTIRATIQKGITFITANDISADSIITLSAKGSKNRP
jgi:hypothetical protein